MTLTAPLNEKPNRSKLRLGCLVFAGILVALIVIGEVNEHLNPSLSVEGSVGKLHVVEYDTGSIKNAGWDVAREVWNAAHEHPRLQEIYVEVELYVAGGGLTDKYGNKVPEPYIMGTIPVRNLVEVRRYVSEDAYIYNNQDDYADQISRLNYADLFEKK